MPYSIQQLDLPIPAVLDEVSSPFDSIRGSPHMLSELDALLSGIEGTQVYVIIDLTQHTFVFSELVMGLGLLLRQDGGFDISHITDSRVTTLLVGNGTLVKLLASGLKQDQYGNRQSHLFSTCDEALTYIKNQAQGG